VNFRSVQDIQKMSESKLLKHVKATGPNSRYRPDASGLRQAPARKDIVEGDSKASDDRAYLAAKLAEAKQKLSLGKMRDAVRLLEDLKTEQAQHSDVYYLLGESYRRTGSRRSAGHIEQAIENLSEALKYEQFTEHVWKSLGLAYLKTDRAEKGCEMLQRFARRSGAWQESEAVADGMARAGFYGQAETAYTTALASNERSSGLHLKRAASRTLAGSPKALLVEDIKR
jgi:predicted Zn-dependent protease